MKTEELFLFPFGGNAREAAVTVAAINRANPRRWRLRGFLDDDARTHGRACGSAKVLGGRSLALNKTFKGRLCALPGHADRFTQREKIIRSLNWPTDRWATLVDPSAVVAPDAVIGKNTVILANVYIGPAARIGDHCIVLPNSVIHHDAVVEDYSVIGSNVTISGYCRLGRGCYVGSAAALRQEIRIGDGSLIGLGSVVVKNVPAGVVVVGNPGHILRKAK